MALSVAVLLTLAAQPYSWVSPESQELEGGPWQGQGACG